MTRYVLATFFDPRDPRARETYAMSVKADSPRMIAETDESWDLRKPKEEGSMLKTRPNTVGIDAEGHELITAQIKPEELEILTRAARAVEDGPGDHGFMPWLCIGSSSAAYGLPCPIIRFRRSDEPRLRCVLGA